jgi:hypothetical protein
MAKEPVDNNTSQVPDKKKDQEHIPLFNSGVADVAGIVLTAASSIGAALLMIDKNFFRNAEKEKRFEKFHKIRDAERASPKTTSLRGREWLERIREIERSHEKAVEGELKEMGISGIAKPLEKFKSLRAHQKDEVVFTMAAVAAGAIGVVSSIIGNRVTGQKERELADKLDDIKQNSAHR